MIVEKVELFVQDAIIPVDLAYHHPGDGLLASTAGFDQRLFRPGGVFFYTIHFVRHP